MIRGINGLPQSGISANKLLKKRLKPHGYYEVPDTPGLFKHESRPIQFTLVVDDFGVKYVRMEHAQHLIQTLKKYYTISEDWEGELYCGVTLKWNYNESYANISMPGYVQKMLQRSNTTPPPNHNIPLTLPPQRNMEKRHKNPSPKTTPPTSLKKASIESSKSSKASSIMAEP
ncbi:hypothetical protein ACHAXS_000725 [Conticribra weissflogii]